MGTPGALCDGNNPCVSQTHVDERIVYLDPNQHTNCQFVRCTVYGMHDSGVSFDRMGQWGSSWSECEFVPLSNHPVWGELPG